MTAPKDSSLALASSAEGPIARPRVEPDEKDSLFGALARIFPAGYGSSGSLCCVTVPGRDDRHIVAEEDCVNVRSVVAVAAGWIFMDSGEGIRVLQQERDGTLEEVAVDPEKTDGMDCHFRKGLLQMVAQSTLVTDPCRRYPNGRQIVRPEPTRNLHPPQKLHLVVGMQVSVGDESPAHQGRLSDVTRVTRND